MADKLVIQLWVYATLIILVMAIFIVWFMVINRTRMNRLYLEQTRREFERAQRELRIRLEEREVTLVEISREIHDNFGQLASSVHRHLLHALREEDPAKRDKLISDGLWFSGVLNNKIRKLSQTMNIDPALEHGLLNAIELQLEYVYTDRITADISSEDDGSPIDTQTSRIIYRIFQEALKNILTHSNASHIRVTYTNSPEFIGIGITDNGKGFDLNDTFPGGMGIRNMQARAKLLEGDFRIASIPGGGCSIVIKIPKHSIVPKA